MISKNAEVMLRGQSEEQSGTQLAQLRKYSIRKCVARKISAPTVRPGLQRALNQGRQATAKIFYLCHEGGNDPPDQAAHYDQHSHVEQRHGEQARHPTLHRGNESGNEAASVIPRMKRAGAGRRRRISSVPRPRINAIASAVVRSHHVFEYDNSLSFVFPLSLLIRSMAFL